MIVPLSRGREKRPESTVETFATGGCRMGAGSTHTTHLNLGKAVAACCFGSIFSACFMKNEEKYGGACDGWEKTGEAALAASPQKGTMTAHEDARVTTRSTCDHILESSARADGSEGIPSRHASRASKHIPQVNPQCRTRAFLLSRQYRSDLPGQFIPYPRDNVNHAVRARCAVDKKTNLRVTERQRVAFRRGRPPWRFSPTRSPVAPGEDAGEERDGLLNDRQSGADIYLHGVRIEGGNVSPQGPQRARGARGQHEGRPASSIQRQVSAHDEQGREYPHDPP